MPSWLTNDIFEGKDLSLASFVWRCASQSFHDSSSVPTVEEIQNEKGGDTKEDIQKLEEELDALFRMSDEEITALEEKDCEESSKRFEEAREEASLRRERYDKLSLQLQNWKPKAECLQELKKLCERMIQQDRTDWEPPNPKWYKHTVRDPYTARQERIEVVRDQLNRTIERMSQQAKQKRDQVFFIRSLEREFPRPAK